MGILESWKQNSSYSSSDEEACVKLTLPWLTCINLGEIYEITLRELGALKASRNRESSWERWSAVDEMYFMHFFSLSAVPIPYCEGQLELKQKAVVLLARGVRGENLRSEMWWGKSWKSGNLSGERPKSAYELYPNFWLITELHMRYVERPQGAQQKAAIGSFNLAAIHLRGNRIWSLSPAN